jgi:hypothetical protein
MVVESLISFDVQKLAASFLNGDKSFVASSSRLGTLVE